MGMSIKGMTIKEAKEAIRQNIIVKAISCNQDDDEYREALMTLLIAVKKYEKIVEIVKNTDKDSDTIRNALAFGDIAKVVEDGND